MSLRFSLIAASAALVLAATSAFAATPAAPTKTLSASQQRMADCSHQSAGKKGADHKAFMSACLKGDSTAAATPAAAPAAAAAAPAMTAKQTQQQKMTSCNADAKTKALAGAARKTFMSGCLKGGAAAPATP
ncbi:PsiF family protein [Rhodanobacter sp. C03]|uniref:PsiF family protein n=1 Tax=Rhodanobacter sp. C03 TaxID=1945858 RepID=UPI000984BB16|nr:PsiF family protein [Rhodanobacter sp. C03]OOG60080.1 phosphate starvation-inducible protein PsiF [Rhodanobacter sp. C03]